MSKRDSTISGVAARHVSTAPSGPFSGLKLTRTTDRKDARHLPDTLQQTRQMLRVSNRHAHVDGSCRLRPIGSGVHHLDADFFAREQIADVPDQSLSVYGDNRERHGLARCRIGPCRGYQPVGVAGTHARQARAIRAMNGHAAAHGRVAGDGFGLHRRATPRKTRRQVFDSAENDRRAAGFARRTAGAVVAPARRTAARAPPPAKRCAASSSNFRNQARTLERLRG